MILTRVRTAGIVQDRRVERAKRKNVEGGKNGWFPFACQIYISEKQDGLVI
jgi:hypothetical protein